MKRSHLFTAAAGAVAAIASPAYALNVGEARVLSYTDQPLRVLIPIKAQSWEWRAMWASAQTYQHGLGLTATLYKPTGDRTEGVIEIRSKAPITEPIVDLQITFETGHRTTIHRTPILVDIQQPSISVAETQIIAKNPLAQYERPASIIEPTQPNTSSDRVANAPVRKEEKLLKTPVLPEVQSYPQKGPFPEVTAVVTPVNEHIRASSYEAPPEFLPSSARASQSNNIPMPPSLERPLKAVNPSARVNQHENENQYVVKSGDGLHAIANKNKPALWSTDETMRYIFKNNRQAFSGSSYNTLKSGAVITFSWNETQTLPSQPSLQHVLPKGTAFPELRSAENFTEPTVQPRAQASSTTFTENDARAAVLRYRMVQIQKELNVLQSSQPR